jgi:hypothetical protein
MDVKDRELSPRERIRARRAARVAIRALRGTLGEVIARDLRAYAESGRGDALLDQTVGELLGTRHPVLVLPQ